MNNGLVFNVVHAVQNFNIERDLHKKPLNVEVELAKLFEKQLSILGVNTVYSSVEAFQQHCQSHVKTYAKLGDEQPPIEVAKLLGEMAVQTISMLVSLTYQYPSLGTTKRVLERVVKDLVEENPTEVLGNDKTSSGLPLHNLITD